MGGHHEHVGAPHLHTTMRAGERHKGPLLAAFILLAVFMVVEVVAGLATNSLALLSDAGHMVTDVIGVGMALAAIQLASRGSERRYRTFGLYRLEILAALANAVLLAGVAGYVIVEAVRRFGDAPDVDDTTMLIVAVIGLVANLVAFALLRCRLEGVVERRRRLPGGALRHGWIGRRDRRRRGDRRHRLVVGRSGRRHRHRRVDPAAGVAAGRAGAAHRHAVGPTRARPRRRRRRAVGDRRGRRRARSPRVDPDVGHGGRFGTPTRRRRQ